MTESREVPTALQGWSELPHDERFPAVVAEVSAALDVPALLGAMGHVLGERPVVLVDGTGMIKGAEEATRLRRAIATAEASGRIDAPWISEPSTSQALLGAALLTGHDEALLVTWPAGEGEQVLPMVLRALSARGAYRPVDWLDLTLPVRGQLR